MPVTVGGVRIEPGDIVVLDGDGVVVVPQRRCDEVLAASEARQAREQEWNRSMSVHLISASAGGFP